MNDYDIYLRHAAVRGGEWAGFALAWKGLAGIPDLEAHPYLRWRPWILDPANPNDPTAGSWGIWQWRLHLALLDGVVGLLHAPPSDGRSIADMRADLLGYQNVPALQLEDADGAIYTVKVTGYSEQVIEPYEPEHPNGGWVAVLELAEAVSDLAEQPSSEGSTWTYRIFKQERKEVTT